MTPSHTQIDEILDNFDFNRVYRAMTALNWTYATIGVPPESYLRSNARTYLHRLSSSTDSLISTGGFTYFKDDDGYLGIRFCIDEYYTNPEY